MQFIVAKFKRPISKRCFENLYSPRYLDLIMYLVLKGYSSVHVEYKISNIEGPDFVSGLSIYINHVTVTMMSSVKIFFQVYKSDKVVHVEPEMSIMVFILCLVGKLNPGYVTVMMTSSIKFFLDVAVLVEPEISSLVLIFVWSVYCIQTT